MPRLRVGQRRHGRHERPLRPAEGSRRSAKHEGLPVSESSPTAARSVPCPNCRKPASFGPANPWRPFCSERCRSVDLGAWASERFRVPAQAPTEDDTAPPAH